MVHILYLKAVFLTFIPVITFSSLIRPENVFSWGSVAYRKLLIDAQSSSLYVGTNGHLFKLWAYNINDTTTDGLFTHAELPLSITSTEECQQIGLRDCSNSVRSIFLREDRQTLLICSSNAIKPQIREYDANTLKERSEAKNIIGVCSPDASLNTTAVFVEWGNPGDLPAFYSGIRTGLSLDNHLIYRPPLIINGKEVYPSMRTVYTDSKWLNEPQFVSSFTAGNYIYFFFREIAIEHEACGRVVYSRVARLCKKDIGGKNVLRQVWTSFVKARLNCSSGQHSMLYFDQLQSLQQIKQHSDTLLYAAFTTPHVSFGGSAVCVFSLDAIDRLFEHGMFTEQVSVGGLWTITSPERVPSYRPGTCFSDSTSIPDGDLHFAKTHLLMADSVAGSILLSMPQHLFTHIVVDTADSVNVVYVYSQNMNMIYKISHSGHGTNSHSKVLISYELENLKNAFAMAILPGEFFYLSDERAVHQFALAQCGIYTTCMECAVDPYCSWNLARSICYRRDNMHSSAIGWVSGDTGIHEKCFENNSPTTVKIFAGDAVHLHCDRNSEHWRLNGEKVLNTNHLLFTTEGGLVLLNASSAHDGLYECVSDENVIRSYQVQVDEAECAQPTSVKQFQSVYREWCKKFSNYRKSADKWQIWFNENESCPK